MSQIAYLTVQDHLWINLNVTKKPAQWNYAKLEEATYYQYNYGQSNDPIAQAARYAVSFPKKQPFEQGNEATAFVGLLTFMGINGFRFTVAPSEAAAWFKQLLQHPNEARSRIREAFVAGVNSHVREVEEVGEEVLATYGVALASLA